MPMRGLAGSGSPAIIVRPITLVSMPTPLMSLPMRSMSSTSRSSIGSRAACVRARSSSAGSTAGMSAAGTARTSIVRSRACSTIATPPHDVAVGEHVLGDARHQLAQPPGAVGVQRLGLDPLAEPDGRHLHEPALVRAVEVGVLLDAVDDDRRGRGRGVGVGDDRHREVVLAGDRDDVHRRAHGAALPAVDEPVRREDVALAGRGGATVAAHRRHEERRGALGTHPGDDPGDDGGQVADAPRADRDRHLGAGRDGRCRCRRACGRWPRRRRRASAPRAGPAPGGSAPRPSPREPPRVLEGVLQRVGEGDALPGDVERRAVVDRRADDRQAERDVDPGVERQQLHRPVALVVVHAHDRVVAAAVHGLVEHGVGRVRAAGVDARGARLLDGRGDPLDVLGAEQPVLAGVRVEPADGDARRVEEPPQRRIRELDHVEHAARLHALDRLAQRAVRADVGDGERPAAGERQP